MTAEKIQKIDYYEDVAALHAKIEYIEMLFEHIKNIESEKAQNPLKVLELILETDREIFTTYIDILLHDMEN